MTYTDLQLKRQFRIKLNDLMLHQRTDCPRNPKKPKFFEVSRFLRLNSSTTTGVKHYLIVFYDSFLLRKGTSFAEFFILIIWLKSWLSKSSRSCFFLKKLHRYSKSRFSILTSINFPIQSSFGSFCFTQKCQTAKLFLKVFFRSSGCPKLRKTAKKDSSRKSKLCSSETTVSSHSSRVWTNGSKVSEEDPISSFFFFVPASKSEYLEQEKNSWWFYLCRFPNSYFIVSVG